MHIMRTSIWLWRRVATLKGGVETSSDSKRCLSTCLDGHTIGKERAAILRFGEDGWSMVDERVVQPPQCPSKLAKFARLCISSSVPTTTGY